MDQALYAALKRTKCEPYQVGIMIGLIWSGLVFGDVSCTAQTDLDLWLDMYLRVALNS